MKKKLLKSLLFVLLVILGCNLLAAGQSAWISHSAFTFDVFQNLCLPMILALALQGTFKLSKVRYKSGSEGGSDK